VQACGRIVEILIILRIKDSLSFPVAVADDYENHPAKIPDRIDPARQCHSFACIPASQLSASMCAFAILHAVY
jgi:hypothetical protein